MYNCKRPSNQWILLALILATIELNGVSCTGNSIPPICHSLLARKWIIFSVAERIPTEIESVGISWNH